MDDITFIVGKLRRGAQELVNACDEHQISDDPEDTNSRETMMILVKGLVVNDDVNKFATAITGATKKEVEEES